jgi:dTDP-4-dehydrorhamnose reductase
MIYVRLNSTDVDEAEPCPANAAPVNAHAQATLAQQAVELSAWLAHYHTDYFLYGTARRPWTAEDRQAPLNAYERTKLVGDRTVREAGCHRLIPRPSWLYAAKGRNFLRMVLKLAAERERLEVVNVQHGTPTGADQVADVSAHMLRSVLGNPALSGINQALAGGCTDWCSYPRFAIEVAETTGPRLRLRAEQIVPVSSAERPAQARRPLNSRLDSTKLRDRFGLHLPDWQAGVERAVLEMAVPTP